MFYNMMIRLFWRFSNNYKNIHKYLKMLPPKVKFDRVQFWEKVNKHRGHRLDIGYWEDTNVCLMCLECDDMDIHHHRNTQVPVSTFSFDKLT